MKLITVLMLLALLPAALLAQNDRQKDEIKREIVAVMNAQTEAWNRGDVDGFMQGYWRSPDLIFVSGDNVTRGWQPTLDRYKANYNSREKMGTLKFSDIEINVLSKSSAVVLGSWSLTRAKDTPKGKFTLLFRKLKDGWRIVHDHTS